MYGNWRTGNSASAAIFGKRRQQDLPRPGPGRWQDLGQRVVSKFQSASTGKRLHRADWSGLRWGSYRASKNFRPPLSGNFCIGLRHPVLSDTDNPLLQRHAVLSFRICRHFAGDARPHARRDGGLQQPGPLRSRTGGSGIRTPRFVVRDHRRRRDDCLPVRAAGDPRGLRGGGAGGRNRRLCPAFHRKRRLHHAFAHSPAVWRRMALRRRSCGRGARMPRRHLRIARRRSGERHVGDRSPGCCRRLDGRARQRRHPQLAPERRRGA